MTYCDQGQTQAGDSCYERGMVKDNVAAFSYLACSVLRLSGFTAWKISNAQRLYTLLVFKKTDTGKAFIELAKDIVKALPLSYRLVRPWLRLKRLIANRNHDFPIKILGK